MLKGKIHKQVIYLGIISLFTDIASEMLYPVTPIFLTTVLGTSMAAVGLIEGLAEITAGLLKGYFGVISDKLHKRSIFVIIGYGLSALSKPLPGLFPKFGVVLSSRISDRIGKGVRTAPRDALLAGYANGNTGAVFGFHRSMDTLGAAIGPILALLLLSFTNNNFQLIYLIAFVPSIFALIFTFFIKDKAAEREKHSQFKYFGFYKTAPSAYKRFLILFTLFSLVNSSDVFLILKSRDVSDSNTLSISGYILYNFVYAGFSYPAGLISDKLSKEKVLVFGILLFSTVYLGFALTTNIVIIFSLFAFYGIYAASTEGISKALISDLIEDKYRASAIGLLTMLSSFAILIGSILTGFLWDRFGSILPFLISSFISFIIAIILYLTHKNYLKH